MNTVNGGGATRYLMINAERFAAGVREPPGAFCFQGIFCFILSLSFSLSTPNVDL